MTPELEEKLLSSQNWFQFCGWKGGTIHQVSDELNIHVSLLLDITPAELLQICHSLEAYLHDCEEASGGL